LLVDSHAHLNDPRLAVKVPELLQAAKAAGVNQIINVGYDLTSSALATQQAVEHPMLFAAVGLHPHDAKQWTDEMGAQLDRLSRAPAVVAWGEIGLDYHYDNSPRQAQQHALRVQLELAKSRQLPVIIHDRDAHADLLRILRELAPYPQGGVMHCYSGSAEMLQDFLRLGMYISFAGPITFKNARKSVQAAAQVPLERLLVETDAPYLAPVPHRGKENHPALVALVAQQLAQIRGMDYQQLCDAVRDNARALFGLPVVSR
jgi:TatD DNase family protein